MSPGGGVVTNCGSGLLSSALINLVQPEDLKLMAEGFYQKTRLVIAVRKKKPNFVFVEAVLIFSQYCLHQLIRLL